MRKISKLRVRTEPKSVGLQRHVASGGVVARLFAYALVFCFCATFSGAHPNGSAAAPVLKPGTKAAFHRYVDLTEARNQKELQDGRLFLWMDALGEGERVRHSAELKRGEVKIEQLETRDGGAKISCPAGMIHHWRGLVFIPKANLQNVLDVVQDYDHHAEYYAPDVDRAKIESREGDHFVAFLRFRRHKVITVVLNTEHDVRYFRDAPGRAHSRSSATRIAEVENAGKENEREKPPGDDGGFLWGMETWWRMEERDGGVYVQSEVVSLTRDIPTGLGWLIGPFVTSIPKETLTFTLEATRRAVTSVVRRGLLTSPPSASATLRLLAGSLLQKFPHLGGVTIPGFLLRSRSAFATKAFTKIPIGVQLPN